MAMQVVQAVQAVHLESDAFLVCLNHALSTEKEEVMGLCIGELNDDTSHMCITAAVSHAQRGSRAYSQSLLSDFTLVPATSGSATLVSSPETLEPFHCSGFDSSVCVPGSSYWSTPLD
ncbi:Lys-63-specific deubiquitinase BRCC36-like protein [Pteropus alecto]|uniref:Lys-63-specific deubiquitinase BRCC36-like protein n=1 Tax=Pteropus alecto TaxID=9402 RepID=L5L4F5_PTEAL|nr:Lys-63-specific deubiquitinase BRCC36-like protein [Pteropus alecto]